MPAEYEPTAEQRALVESASAIGITQAEIANQLKIDEKTLRKHFQDELSSGKFKVDMTAGNAALGAKACQRPALWLSRHDLVACPDIWHKLLRSRAELELCAFRARDFCATAELQIVHCCCQPSRSQLGSHFPPTKRYRG